MNRKENVSEVVKNLLKVIRGQLRTQTVRVRERGCYPKVTDQCGITVTDLLTSTTWPSKNLRARACRASALE